MNRINLICLGVRDVARSLAFYRGLGFKTPATEDSPPVVFFDNQGTKLQLFPLQELVKDIDSLNPPAVREGSFSGMTLAINMKSAQEVDEFMARAIAQGATVAKAPELVSWGGYSGYFQDPDGYYWEVAYSEIWRFDDYGMLIVE